MNLLTKIKENILANNLRGKSMEKPLVAFGCSSAEVFDYIFGKNALYHPFWASGWSARSLNDLKHTDRDMLAYIPILESLPKDSNILLHFGMTDVEFSLPMLARDKGVYDLPLFLKEMVEGVLTFKSYLNHNFGFTNIYSVFTSPPIWLPANHWETVFKFKPFPLKIRGQMLLDFSEKLSQVMPTINCLDKLIISQKNPICSPDYMRARISHHIGFIEAQDLIYSELQEIEGILKQRNPKLKEYYRHTNVGVDSVRNDRKPRINTCI